MALPRLFGHWGAYEIQQHPDVGGPARHTLVLRHPGLRATQSRGERSPRRLWSSRPPASGPRSSQPSRSYGGAVPRWTYQSRGVYSSQPRGVYSNQSRAVYTNSRVALPLTRRLHEPVTRRLRGTRHAASTRTSACRLPPRRRLRIARRVAAPYRYYRPYYSFRPRFSLGFGLWIGYPVAYTASYYYGHPYPGYYGYPAYLRTRRLSATCVRLSGCGICARLSAGELPGEQRSAAGILRG